MIESVPSALKDRVARVVTAAHGAVFDLTRGRVLGRIAGMPAVKLTTTGRRSGEPRAVMLTSPVQRDDGSVVLVASYGGDDRHPAWYRNLQANPEVELVFRGERFRAEARTATASEKDELWPRITSTYGGYAGYQRRTDRDIPVVICERPPDTMGRPTG
ncbi:MAG TPA: nitroreductase family deazaflavin-dependent oxidoreductase [Nitriliruptorales bacterium]